MHAQMPFIWNMNAHRQPITRWMRWNYFFSRTGRFLLDPSPGRFTGRCIKSTGSGGYPLGSYTAGGHKLFHITALAFRTDRGRVAGAYNQFLKTMTTGLALIFINRHFSILSKIFYYIIAVKRKMSTAVIRFIERVIYEN